jgi:hypothetical protein
MAALPDRLVLLGVAHDELEANVWRDVLARESIGIFVKSADPLATFGVAPLPGSLRVFVRANDEKRARWFLGDGAGVEE